MALFSIKKKIYYHDTDCGGVVYYSNYLKYFEEARTEYLLSKGIDLRECVKEGFFFVVSNVEIKYKGPAKYGDDLRVESEVQKIKPASLDFNHKIKRNETILVECATRLVSVDNNLKPTAIPKHVAELLGKG